jgi:hypothetical protein
LEMILAMPLCQEIKNIPYIWTSNSKIAAAKIKFHCRTEEKSLPLAIEMHMHYSKLIYALNVLSMQVT